MKKINSINYGGKVLGIGLIFMVPIPSLLLCINHIVEGLDIAIFAYISLGIGILICLLFMCFLVIELKQDKRIEQYYCKHRNVKIEIGTGKYECSACGNRLITFESTYCNMCGGKFEAIADITPQEILDYKK